MKYNTPQEDFYYERLRSFCRVYYKLERNGLNCFEPDGTIGGYDGIITLQTMINYFQKKEWFEKCAYLHHLSLELRESMNLNYK